MKMLLAGLVLCGGCSLSTANYAALTASTAALACDWGQSSGVASLGQRGVWRGHWEDNPIMGPRPSQGEIGLYFATIAALNVAMWLALPKRYRWIAPTAIAVVQAPTILRNAARIERSPNAGPVMNGYACGI